MAKLRVHQLAKELGIDSKVIINEAAKHGISLKNHMSALEGSEEMMVRAFLEEHREVAPQASPEVAAPATPAEVSGRPESRVPAAPPAESTNPPGQNPVPPRPSGIGVTARPPMAGGVVAARPGQPPARPAPPAQPGRPERLEPRPHAPSRDGQGSGHGHGQGQPPQRPTPGVVARPGGPMRPSAPMRPAASDAPQRQDSHPGSDRHRSAPPPQTVVARPGIAARPGIVARPAAELRAREEAEREASRQREDAERDASQQPAHDPNNVPAPRVVQMGSATARPPRPGDASIVARPVASAAPARRQAQIVGRRDLPTPPRPAAGGNALSRSGEGGSGLVVARRDGVKRTFVNTGRRGPLPPGARGPGGPGMGGGAPGRRPPMGGGPGGQGPRGRGPLTRRGEIDPSTLTPDSLTVELPMTVKGLAEKLQLKVPVIQKVLLLQHKRMVKINDPLDKETIELLGLEFNCDITVTEKVDIETKVIEDLQAKWIDSDQSDYEVRAPIVAFLGHVDHGKTSLLDRIRKTGIAAREHGGITQHIGASRVDLDSGQAVVLLDTPGHRAFTEMRARGAQVTDVVVLVVAADDGVMPQTKEAIAHAKAAGTPIVVAMNKIDKHEANPLKVRQELAVEGLQDESWGGQTQVIEVSAQTGQGIDQLLEAVLLEAEVLDLKANPNRPGLATVIEAEQTRGEGNTARLVVTDGTLAKGDFFVCGTAYGRVRAIKGPAGKILKEAGPAMPVEITGLNELPNAGDKLYVLESLEEAREIATKRLQLAREKEIAKAAHVSLENLFDQLKGNTLKIILKVDVTGSLQVLQKEIKDLAHPEVRPEIIHSAVGGITETDVTLADASDAIILGFHVSADAGARRLAEQTGVEIRLYQVIYKMIDEIKEAMEGKLAPEQREVILGDLDVRATWKVSRLGTIAGCFVTNGLIRRDSKIRVSRDGIVILDNGRLQSLRRIKDDVREVKEGFECGLLIDGFERIDVGDVVTAYEIQSIRRTFDSPPLKA